MKTFKYTGLFNNGDGEYTLEVRCYGILQAFILLTAKAINSGKSYQLKTITEESGVVTEVGDINKIMAILS